MTFFKFQNGRMSSTMTHATIPGLIYPTVAFVQESSATVCLICRQASPSDEKTFHSDGTDIY